MRAIMEHAGLNENLNTGLWPKCTAITTKLENITVNPHEENVHMRSYTKNYRLRKTLKDFWINSCCTQYPYLKKNGRQRKDVNVTRL